MRTLLLVSAALSALIVNRAEAIEMFTNFNNGQNIGFPPMEVPTSIYGRGGWHRGGMQGAPLRTIPPVPAMMPSGFNSGYNCPAPAGQTIEVIGRGEDEVQLIADRRSRRSGSIRNTPDNATRQIDPAPSGADYFAPHPAKPLPSDSDQLSTSQPTDTTLHPVMLHAMPGIAPENSGASNGHDATSSRRFPTE
jgi:hypothetical protein